MKVRRVLASGLLVLLGLVGFAVASPQSLQQQNEILFRQFSVFGQILKFAVPGKGTILVRIIQKYNS